MRTLKKYLTPLIAACVMLAAAALTVLYQRGYYDFAFAPRVYASDAGETDGPADVYEYNEDDYNPPEVDDNVSGVFDPESINGDSAGSASAGSSSGGSSSAGGSSSSGSGTSSAGGSSADDSAYAAAAQKRSVTALKKEGYVHSTADFDPATHVIGRVTTAIDFKKSLYGKNQTYTLAPYLGYLIYDDGSNVSLLGINGVVSVTGINALTKTYLRDSYGHPLFLLGGKYYYLVDSSNNMVEVEYNPLYAPSLVFDRRAADSTETAALKRYYVEVQEPHRFNADGEDITDEIDHILSEAAKDGKDIADPEVYAKLKIPEYTVELVTVTRWGYVNEYGGAVIPAQYYFASEFDKNGYAVVAERWGVAKVINTRGSTVITLNGLVTYPEERGRRPVQENYYLPDSFGIESIGMFAFDHGLIRLRYMQYDYKKETEIVRDRDVLAYTDGTLFPIPSDYALKGYSNGVLLLEKNGKYGFMDYMGRWIAQPIYTYAQPFIEGLAVIGFEEGKKGMIDTEGNIILPFRYDYISNVSSGVFSAFQSSEGWTIFNKMKGER